MTRGYWRRGGFALRELSAAISLVVLLAGIFSVWSEAFERKRDAIRCLTNGRLMMQAVALYEDDHRGLLPPNEETTTTRGHSWITLDGWMAPGATNEVALRDPQVNLLAPYVKD
ncbi:MAG: hypothetical protein ACXW3L_02615, partial [Limisphaerales bacterium]